mmetsp:Transcript_38158/g.109497  ORF Transcript_38158/g.109497 Transcript_38158/m.109497 type:complete len:236 (+) Transcript_38158:686-1393(+)
MGPPGPCDGRKPGWPSPASRRMTSMAGKAAFSARPARPPSSPSPPAAASPSPSTSAAAAAAVTCAGRSSETRLETAEPPCPSNIANMACLSNGASKPRMATSASSMAGLHPLISEEAQFSTAAFPERVVLFLSGPPPPNGPLPLHLPFPFILPVPFTAPTLPSTSGFLSDSGVPLTLSARTPSPPQSLFRGLSPSLESSSTSGSGSGSSLAAAPSSSHAPSSNCTSSAPSPSPSQ